MNLLRSSVRLTFLIIVAVTAYGCHPSTSGNTHTLNATGEQNTHRAKESNLEFSRERWQAIDMQHYDYRLSVRCYCTETYTRPMQVSVRSGQVVSAQYLDNGRHAHGEVLDSLRSIDEWFEYIAYGLSKPFFTLEVEYNSERGYPNKIIVDIRQRVADDEQEVVISDLTAAHQPNIH